MASLGSAVPFTPNLLPVGGSAGDVLTRTGTGTFDVGWGPTMGAAPGVVPVSGRVIDNRYRATPMGSTAMNLALNYAYYSPIYLAYQTPVTAMICFTAISSSSTVTMALFTANRSTFKPASYLFGAGAIPASSNNLQVALTSTVVVQPGWYYVAVTTDGSSMAVGAISPGAVRAPVAPGIAGSPSVTSWISTTASGLQNSPAVTPTSAGTPMIGLVVA